MRITVAICTWNRARLLDQALASMHGLTTPRGVGWEALVVNNNCTDETDRVIARHAQFLPLRRLWEPRQGKSHALNTAIDNIDSDLILWTDDDVLVDCDWLAEHARAAQAHPDAAFFAGPIRPWFETDPPAWLRAAWPRISYAYAALDLGDLDRSIDERSLPHGANFAIRTGIQRRFRYDTRLGRVGAGEVRGEESEVVRRLLKAGYPGRWTPRAKVRHFIPRRRLTLDYVRRFFYGMGQTEARLEKDAAAPAHRVWRRTRLWAKAAVNQAKYRVGRRLAGPERWMKYYTKSSYYRGRLSALSPGEVEPPQAKAA